MAHFAIVGSDNIVRHVYAVVNDVITDSDGNEQEELGIKFLEKQLMGTGDPEFFCGTDTIVQTSYNHNFRKQYAGVGMTYDKENDVFVSPQPFPSWTLDSDHDWQAPTPLPADSQTDIDKPDPKRYEWNEESQVWELQTIII